GRYTFTTYSDDGVRLYVDGRRVLDSWRPMRGYRSVTVDLDAGEHTIVLEYFEQKGVALVRLSWHR
ncbi:MAG: glycosyl hydrolase, partial [Chloroflexi bacterium]